MRNLYGIGTNYCQNSLRSISIGCVCWFLAVSRYGGTISCFESFGHSYRHISARYHATQCNHLHDSYKMPHKAARSTTIRQLIELHELWHLTSDINLTHTYQMNESFFMTSKYCHLLHALKGIHTHKLTFCTMPSFCFVITTNTHNGIHLLRPSDTNMRQEIESSVLQVKACRLFDAQPLPLVLWTGESVPNFREI